MKNKFLLVATLLLAQLGAMASSITYNGSINLDFTDLPNGTYTIYRAEGRFANFVQIAQTNQKTYVDNNLGGKSPYTYYYKVQNGGNVVAELSMDVALFGPNVKMYSPADDRAAIAKPLPSRSRIRI